MEMLLKQPHPLLSFLQPSLQQPQSQLSLAECAAHADQVSRPRAGTQDGPAWGDFANYGKVDRGQGTSGSVASSQDQTEATGCPRHSFQEAVKPFCGAGKRKRQAQQEIEIGRASC